MRAFSAAEYQELCDTARDALMPFDVQRDDADDDVIDALAADGFVVTDDREDGFFWTITDAGHRAIRAHRAFLGAQQ